MNIWQELGIEVTTDLRNIKRAYTKRLKVTQPEDDPEGFQRLRNAYEHALHYAQTANDSDIDDTETLRSSQVAETISDKRETKPSLATHVTINEVTPEPTVQDTTPNSVPEYFAFLDGIYQSISDKQGDDAITVFAQALDSEELYHLEKRHNFEINLIRILASAQEFPHQLAQVASEQLHWEQDARHLLANVPQETRYVFARISARREYLKLRHQAHFMQAQYIAISNITGKYRPWLFRIHAMRKSVKEATLKLIHTLQHAFPEVIQFEIDPRNIAWWQAATSRLHFGWGKLIVSYAMAVILFVIADKNLSIGHYFPSRSIGIGLCFGLIVLIWYSLIRLYPRIHAGYRMIWEGIHHLTLIKFIFVTLIVGLSALIAYAGLADDGTLVTLLTLLLIVAFKPGNAYFLMLFAWIVGGILMSHYPVLGPLSFKNLGSGYVQILAMSTILWMLLTYIGKPILAVLTSIPERIEMAITLWIENNILGLYKQSFIVILFFYVLLFSIVFAIYESSYHPGAANRSGSRHTTTQSIPSHQSTKKQSSGKELPQNNKPNKLGQNNEKSAEELAVSLWNDSVYYNGKQRAIDILAVQAQKGSERAISLIKEYYAEASRKNLLTAKKGPYLPPLEFPISIVNGEPQYDQKKWDAIQNMRIKNLTTKLK